MEESREEGGGADEVMETGADLLGTEDVDVGGDGGEHEAEETRGQVEA